MTTLMQTATRSAQVACTALLVLAFLLVSAPQSYGQAVDVSINDVGAEPGDTVYVPIEVSNLDDAADVTSYEFDMDFDATIVSYNGFDVEGSLSEAAGFTVDDNPDIPRIGAFGDTPLNDVGSSGELLTLSFVVEAEGNTTVTLSGFAFNDGTPASNPSTPEFLVSSSDLIVSVAETDTAAVGDTVTVPLSTTDLSGAGILSFEFDIAYDGAVVSPVEANPVSVDGTIASDFTADGNKISGETTLRVGAFGQDALQGSGTLIKLRFAVVGGESTDLDFLNFTFNDGQPVAVTQDGSLAAFDPGDVMLGDLTGNGSVSAFDANRTLLASLGLSPPRPLSRRDSIAADVTANGSISAGDASAILRFVVGDIDSFSEVQGGSSSSLLASGAELTWGEVQSTETGSILPVRVEGDVSNVYALEVRVRGDLSAVQTDEVEAVLPDDWHFVSRVDRSRGVLKMAMAGSQPLRGTGDVVHLPISASGQQDVSVSAEGIIGEGAVRSLGPAPGVSAPGSFTLHGNFPNPARSQTTISFDLPSSATVEVEVFDMLGRRVATIPEQRMQSGSNRSVQLNASGLGAGIYMYRVEADAESTQWTTSGRLVVVK